MLFLFFYFIIFFPFTQVFSPTCLVNKFYHLKFRKYHTTTSDKSKRNTSLTLRRVHILENDAHQSARNFTIGLSGEVHATNHYVSLCMPLFHEGPVTKQRNQGSSYVLRVRSQVKNYQSLVLCNVSCSRAQQDNMHHRI